MVFITPIVSNTHTFSLLELDFSFSFLCLKFYYLFIYNATDNAMTRMNNALNEAYNGASGAEESALYNWHYEVNTAADSAPLVLKAGAPSGLEP